jgi:hypothetical protein
MSASMSVPNAALAKVCADFIIRVPGKSAFHETFGRAIEELRAGNKHGSFLVLGALAQAVPAVRERFFEALSRAVKVQ